MLSKISPACTISVHLLGKTSVSSLLVCCCVIFRKKDIYKNRKGFLIPRANFRNFTQPLVVRHFENLFHLLRRWQTRLLSPVFRSSFAVSFLPAAAKRLRKCARIKLVEQISGPSSELGEFLRPQRTFVSLPVNSNKFN